MRKEFNTWEQPTFDDDGWTKYGWRCQNHKKLKLGKYVDIGCFTYINAACNVSMMDNVQVGSHCSIYSISTIDKKEGPVILKTNACIGTHSTIMPNVTVGENSIVAAHSFVRDGTIILDNELWVGVPAKKIGVV